MIDMMIPVAAVYAPLDAIAKNTTKNPRVIILPNKIIIENPGVFRSFTILILQIKSLLKFFNESTKNQT